MESIKAVLLEDPFSLYVALAIVFVATAAICHERRSRKAPLLLAIPLVLAAAIFSIERLVVTDREKIASAAEEIARSFEEGNAAAILKHLDEDFKASFQGKTVSKADVRAIAEATRTRYGISRIKVTKFTTEIESNRAENHAVTLITYHYQGATNRTSYVWELTWIKRPEGWRILRVREPQMRLEL